MSNHYDVIIIGSGAGGGTLAHRLAPTSKRILLLERGGWLTREPENWDVTAVYVDNRYVSKDAWTDKTGKSFQPQSHYFVGGATKMYGATLYRLRAKDFGALQHHDGISRAWPIAYDEFEPFSAQAEDTDPFPCAQAAAKQMIKQGRGGRIINISSIREDLPTVLNPAYSASKGGLRMLMRTIAVELDKTQDGDPALEAQLMAEIPMHRWGGPDEVAQLAIYLASDAAAYVTGSTFFIDGGMLRNAGSL